MSALPIYYSIRDFKNGYRGYWLSEQPDSQVWAHGFFWDGRGPHKATQYHAAEAAKEAAAHFVNRGHISEDGFLIEVRATCVAELVAELSRAGFETECDSYAFQWPNATYEQGRLMRNPVTGEACLLRKRDFLCAVGTYLPVPAAEPKQLLLF